MKEWGAGPQKNFPAAARTVLTTSETNKRSDAETMPKEKNRSRRIAMSPDVCSSFTSQIRFKADLSSVNTPEAPKESSGGRRWFREFRRLAFARCRH